MIADKDITIVIQGPVLYEARGGLLKETTKVISKRVRMLFPRSEIIFSTWEGEKTDGIVYDRLILNQDPGATWFNYEDYQLLNNCNRLIVSTKAGISAASRKYVLKIRSDLFVINKNFLRYFYQFPDFDPQYQFVKNRIIAFSLFSIKGHRNCLFTMYRPFHISDWAYFGYQEDLATLYDVPLVKEPEFSQWFLTRCKPFYDIEPHRLWKMPPEQYVTSTFLNKFVPVHLEHTNDISNNNITFSEQLLVNNFLVLDQTQFALVSLKYLKLQLLFEPLISRTALFYRTWLAEYCRYCRVKSPFKRLKYHTIALWRGLWYKVFNAALWRFQEPVGLWVGRFIARWAKRYGD